jgi:hypothetical protein
MLEQFPAIMDSRNVAGGPNNALYHAEATILLRMKEALGGTLAGRSFRVTIDRPMCDACQNLLLTWECTWATPEFLITIVAVLRESCSTVTGCF